jgi:hypothetical protein
MIKTIKEFIKGSYKELILLLSFYFITYFLLFLVLISNK